MFVPVACLRCGKLFQVPPADAGTDVTCPWCREPTPALPVATNSPAPQPLSLDDAEPLAPPKRTRPSFKKLALVALGMASVAALTVAVLGFRTGRGGAAGWVEFTAPDGAFTAAFPAAPTATPVAPNPQAAVTLGGEEYAAAGWYSGVRAWVSWHDLDPAWVKRLADDKDGAITTPALEAERDRRLKQFGGTVAKQGPLQTTDGRGLQVEIDTPGGKRVERYLLAASAARPRLYVVGVEGPKLDPDGPLPARVLTAFRVR